MGKRSKSKKKASGASPSASQKSSSSRLPGEDAPSSPLVTPESSAPPAIVPADAPVTGLTTDLEPGEIQPEISPEIPTHDAEECALRVAASDPSRISTDLKNTSVENASHNNTAKFTEVTDPAKSTNPNSPKGENWANLFKGNSKTLAQKGESYILPSGEVCVKIPNSIIEKHQKSWDSFIIGQFYSDSPPQGLIHTIVNGIWSKQFRDITVSKMKGNAFLFRIPNAQTRRRVISQRLWQIEGQTMFVADWVSGVIPSKPELSSAPIWLELRKVPLQFFNDDGLGRIAGAVGEPKALHPSTANKTNLEVAKVLTLIDPRKPLPEAVNVQFDSGDIMRILVSSPWMSPVCSFCKEIGHSVRRCASAPIFCSTCKSAAHSTSNCTRVKPKPGAKKTKRGSRSRSVSRSKRKQLPEGTILKAAGSVGQVNLNTPLQKWVKKKPIPDTLGTKSSGTATGNSSGVSAAEPDSSDVESSGSDSEEVEEDNDPELDYEFATVLSQRQRKSE
ncbi:unnamed protein product [Microthlaspi erraticum]|uniref:DUF4283 domain-containing protein n=1 Tax=Microthlaspi erraticum TaxID=1685480 RepID=A0A6D2HE64_9BRAS|nr:unnamed protein product [Microthlaspi erraticum]